MQPTPYFPAIMALARSQAPALFIFSFLANLLLLASAIYMLQVYDRVLSSGSLDTLLWLTAMAVGAIAVYGLLEQARRVLLGRISQWLDDQLSAPTVERAMCERLAGGSAEASLKDIADLRAFIGGDGMLTFLDAPWTPIFIAFLWLLHPALGGIGTIGAVLLFGGALANEAMTRRPQQATGAALRRNQTTAGQLIESAETIRPLGMTEAMLARWRDHQQTLSSDLQRLTERTISIGNISRSLRLALQVMILGVGAFYVLQGEITAGAMIAASIILGRALAPIERSIGSWRTFVAARAAHRNLVRLFAANEPPAEPLRLPRPQGRVAVEDLHRVAPGTRRFLLSKISFELRPGAFCAIIGPSGSGKSTLCRLLVGAWQPSHGHVRLDGADLSAWAPDQLGLHLGYLPQQVELFPGTIAENIARLREVNSAQVIAAAQLAGVHEMILRLPLGYQTEVGSYGAKMSGGERQRIGLARALFGDPSLIVLDEPNANLDSDGEAALFKALIQLKEQGRTVILVSHQLNALQIVDYILVLHEGRMRAFGGRDEVLQAIGARPQRLVVAASAPTDFSHAPRPNLKTAE